MDCSGEAFLNAILKDTDPSHSSSSVACRLKTKQKIHIVEVEVYILKWSCVAQCSFRDSAARFPGPHVCQMDVRNEVTLDKNSCSMVYTIIHQGFLKDEEINFFYFL